MFFFLNLGALFTCPGKLKSQTTENVFTGAYISKGSWPLWLPKWPPSNTFGTWLWQAGDDSSRNHRHGMPFHHILTLSVITRKKEQWACVDNSHSLHWSVAWHITYIPYMLHAKQQMSVDACFSVNCEDCQSHRLAHATRYAYSQSSQQMTPESSYMVDK